MQKLRTALLGCGKVGQIFLQAILEGRPPLVTGEEGRVVVEMFTAIYRSNRERKPIRFPVEASE